MYFIHRPLKVSSLLIIFGGSLCFPLLQTSAHLPDPVPVPWPEQFHSILFVNTSKGKLWKTDLWYDWPNGRNFNINQHQLGKLLYNLEWDNGTSFFYTLDSNQECTVMHFEVGILRPNWLDGATYLGQKSMDGFLCNVWEKADFVWYYEDVGTKQPVLWEFYSGKKDINVFVFQNGVWKQEGFNWYIDGGELRFITVTKNTRYAELLDKLYVALSVDRSYYDFRIEVSYPCVRQGTPPYAIFDDSGLTVFIREISKSPDNQIPLCVNLVLRGSCSAGPHMGVDVCNPYGVLDTHDLRTDYEPDEEDNDEHDVVDLPDPCKEEPNLYDLRANPAYAAYMNLNSEPVIEANLYDLRANPAYAAYMNLNSEPVNEANLYDLRANPAYEYYMNLNSGVENEEYVQKVPPRDKQMQRQMQSQWLSFDLNAAPNVGITKPFVKIPSFDVNELGGTGHVDEEDPVHPYDLYLGQVFNCQKDFQRCVHVYAVKNNFDFDVAKSNPGCWYVKCVGENCRWSIRGTKLPNSETFKVSAFTDKHTCDLDVRQKDNRKATPWVVGELIKGRFGEGPHKYQPRHIIDDMKRELGIEMTYEKAWRCREKGLEYVRGSPEASYQEMPSFLYMLQLKNPNSLQDIVTEDGGEFKYCFFALGAFIRGFRHCRPVICIDGSALKSRFGGVLLVAVALDANNGLYPIALGIVDSENNDSWVYFMSRLQLAIGDDIENLVFVSDRHQSIAHALEVVFPRSYHGACFYHVKQNIHARFKTQDCDANFYGAAYAFKQSVFNRHFALIQQIDPRVAEYLREIGFQRWARVYFPVNRYNVMTSNYAESLNSTTADARTWPVTSLLEFIRARLQKWFCERRESANSSTDRLASSREQEMRLLDEQAKHLIVRPIAQYKLQVLDGDDSAVVDLEINLCACGKWQISGMPCIHALAAARFRGMSKYRLCSPYYMIDELRATYAESIYPCGPANDWNVPDKVRNMPVNVPVPRAAIGRPKKKTGRPKTKRIPSQGERIIQQRKCSRCGGLGHNRSTCNRVV